MPSRTVAAPVDVIGPRTVRQALAVVRHLESKARREPNPLLKLDVVAARLRRLGVAATDENRQWALAGVLEEIVTDELARLRPDGGPAAVNGAPNAAAELAQIAADFRTGHRALECWSAIHSRFVAPAGPPMDDVARQAGVGRVTLARRLNEGLVLLSDELRRRELAQRADDVGAGPPSAQRIRLVAEDADGAAVGSAGPGAAGGSGRGDPAAGAGRVVAGIAAAIRAPVHAGLDLTVADARALTAAPPADLTAYRAARVATWSAPEHALDRAFVRLTLVVDGGEHDSGGRWRPKGVFDDLAAALDAADAPVAVVLGAPGAGKSTLLQRFELDEAVAGLRGETDAIPFFVPLARYRGDGAAPPPPPAVWLAARWRERYPALPPLDAFRADGQLTLILDGLNEIPHRTPAAYHDHVAAWRAFLVDDIAAVPGNRAVVSCRSLDYSAPLSSEALRIPQLQVEPLSDDQVRAMLRSRRPALASRLWRALEASPLLEAVRVPYTLQLLLDHVRPHGALPAGTAALFTGIVRQSLRREVERDHAAVRAGAALDERDVRQVVQWRWRDDHQLPSRGRLFNALTDLAVSMQRDGAGGDGAQVRLARPAALAVLGRPDPDAVLEAALATGLLDEDIAADDVRFRHQLLQEYFAARALAAHPAPMLVRQPWRAADVAPPLADVVAALAAGEPLPPLPATGWEEAMGLAAEIAPDAAAFVLGVAATNLALAGRCAARPGVRARLEAATIAGLAADLVARSRDASADLRARIDAARAAGRLGDPRFPVRAGPEGPYIAPPLVALPAGDYPLGRSEPFAALGRTWYARYRPHDVRLGAFALGAFPVTNAEWACFVDAGGYDDARWWDGAAAAAWRRGEGTTAGIHADVRAWVERYRAEPALLERTWRDGSYPTEVYERWRQRLSMSPVELEDHLHELYPSVRHSRPRYWTDRRFDHPSQPVVAVTWYEARAYCAWLAAQTGRPFRLPTDAELEAAARGPVGGRASGRDYPWGGPFDPLKLNGVATHVMTTTPVGVFPDGDSPDGITDLSGNVESWTSTLAGDGDDVGPPTRTWGAALEGAEDAAGAKRVVRGGSWLDNHSRLHPTYGVAFGPDFCPESVGVRVACGG